MSETTPKPSKRKRANRLMKWSLFSLAGLLGFLLILCIAVISLLLWYPQATNTALPYLEDITNNQLQIESAEGRLADGLRLNNIRFKNQSVNLQIDRLEWQWQLSGLLNRHIHFQVINITKPTVKTLSSNKESDSTTNDPFELIAQFTEYEIIFDIDELKLTQASLQFNNEPAIEIAQFNSGIHWQGQTLQINNLQTDYQAYKLQANSRFELINKTEFTAKLNVNLAGLQGFDAVKINTQANGDLNQIRFNLQMTEPYTMRSTHLLKLDQSLIQLDSEFKELKAKINEQWQVNQLQGNNRLRFNLDNQQLASQGKLNIKLKDKPLAEFEYTAEHSQTGAAQFELTGLLKEMGSFKAEGQANLQSLEKLTANAKVQTNKLNLQWLDSGLKYQISSLFDFALSDYQNLTSQLDIQQFDVTGLPEKLAFTGKVNTQHKGQTKTNRSDYAIHIQSGQLNYAEYAGQLQAQLFIKPDFSQVSVPTAKLALGDNSIDLSGQWAETIKLSLSAQLNQLNQLYAPLSGTITATANANGTLLKNLSGFKQAWSTINVDANNIGLQVPGSANQEVLRLKHAKLNAKVPLHQLEWSTFVATADEVLQTTNDAEERILFSKINAVRQTAKIGLASELKVEHPELNLHVEFSETKPNLKQANIALTRFDITQPNTGNWQLVQSSKLSWQPPLNIQTKDLCLQSVENTEAKICLQAQNTQANWSMKELPIFDWFEPWLGEKLSLKGQLNGEGSANWKKALTLKQTLLMPKIDVIVTEQGYKVPFMVKDWQTDIQITPSKSNLKSMAKINETGRLNVDIQAKNRRNQAWSNAKLNGKVDLDINEWPLKGRITELVNFNKTKLNIQSTLSGAVGKPKYSTLADINLNLNLPLLGLDNQAIQLQAQLTPKEVDAKGLWKQQEGQQNERQADLIVKLTDLQTQPKLLASFDTTSIELLKTPFAHLKTSSDMTVTLADGKTHIQGKIQLHDSTVNLDDMPLHQGTSTSDDEIIMNEQGQPISKEKAVSNLSYDVKIGFADKVQVNVQNSELFLGGELQLVQTTENPEMQAFGKVKLRKGYINLDSRNQIQIDESSFLFNGVIANPTLDVNLYRVVDQTTARLNITGNASQPQFVFYSTPALSQGRIINLMVFGRSGDMSKEPNYESQVLSAFYKLGIQNNTPVLNTLTSSLGIQDVYFDVQGQKVSSLLVGRALTDKLYVRYAKDLTGQQNNAVQLFYQLTNKWLLKTNSGNENSSVDVIYRIERK